MTSKTLLLISLMFLLVLAAFAKVENSVKIIPIPVHLETKSGTFSFSARTQISYGKNPELQKVVRHFSLRVEKLYGYTPVIKSAGKGNQIKLKINNQPIGELGNEGYKLDIEPTIVTICANSTTGIFYGIQSLLQMLPEPAVLGKHQAYTIKAVSITDYPRFSWRGLMLDVSRHFFDKEFIKKYIDQMARYKYNVFHWHLTDDPGWRIEIKHFPKLTEVGAWRVSRTGRYFTFDSPRADEKPSYGGYYTQEDIKEIVQYAQERFVTIVPEIDIPGHSKALIAAYPQTSCTGKQETVYAGEKNGPGDNVLCAGNEENFTMISNILDEIITLFPGKYIHIGGDEVCKDFWKACPKCQKIKEEYGLRDEHELQSYFIKRVGKIVESKGKRLIGWDEILQGGLTPNATVMSWQGMEGGISAAKAGHEVVMTPTYFCYLDYMQGEPSVEGQDGSLRVSNVYSFEPVPDGVNSKFILGGQGNVWTEFIESEKRIEYMTWPRALALAEVFWSPKEKRNWESFVPRMEAQWCIFDFDHVNYAPSVYDPNIYPVKGESGELKVAFRSELKDLDIYYTFDFSFPDQYSQKYTGEPFSMPSGSTEIWAISYRHGKPAGRLIRIKFVDLKKRL